MIEAATGADATLRVLTGFFTAFDFAVVFLGVAFLVGMPFILLMFNQIIIQTGVYTQVLTCVKPGIVCNSPKNFLHT
ncbi:MAG TPA: hypothetical protein VLF91_03350 [Candidatus Saccharimonadales bacterium]|nr:hypothetical protein [Candidatus Saccharimonadales bacterium]